MGISLNEATLIPTEVRENASAPRDVEERRFSAASDAPSGIGRVPHVSRLRRGDFVEEGHTDSNEVRENGQLAQPSISGSNMKVGAPLFAFFAKGGHDTARSTDFDFAGTSHRSQHLTRPCKERKSGAPTSERCTQGQTLGPPACHQFGGSAAPMIAAAAAQRSIDRIDCLGGIK